MKQLKSHVRHDDPDSCQFHMFTCSCCILQLFFKIVSLTLPSWSPVLVLSSLISVPPTSDKSVVKHRSTLFHKSEFRIKWLLNSVCEYGVASLGHLMLFTRLVTSESGKETQCAVISFTPQHERRLCSDRRLSASV